MPIQIAFVLQENSWSGSIALLMDFFIAAGNISTDVSLVEEHLFDIQFVSVCPEKMQCFNGLNLRLNQEPALITEEERRIFDVVILPAVWGGLQNRKDEEELLEWLRYQYEKSAVLLGLVTGPFYLAEAGLLSRKQATVHWSFVEQFKLHYPEVDLMSQKGITQAGNCWCASDIVSSLELGVLVLEKFYGAKIAEQCQRYFLQNPFNLITESEQSNLVQIYKVLGVKPTKDQLVKAALELMQQKFHKTITLSEIALRLNTTVRTLNRHFEECIGVATIDSLIKIRIDHACKLLRDTDLAINLVAYKSGFQSQNSFTSSFKLRMGITAREYRKAYCYKK